MKARPATRETRDHISWTALHREPSRRESPFVSWLGALACGLLIAMPIIVQMVRDWW